MYEVGTGSPRAQRGLLVYVQTRATPLECHSGPMWGCPWFPLIKVKWPILQTLCCPWIPYGIYMGIVWGGTGTVHGCPFKPHVGLVRDLHGQPWGSPVPDTLWAWCKPRQSQHKALYGHWPGRLGIPMQSPYRPHDIVIWALPLIIGNNLWSILILKTKLSSSLQPAIWHHLWTLTKIMAFINSV